MQFQPIVTMNPFEPSQETHADTTSKKLSLDRAPSLDSYGGSVDETCKVIQFNLVQKMYRCWRY